MQILLGNHSSPEFHHLAGMFPERVGWLLGPASLKACKIRPWLEPVCFDNDCFPAWQNNTQWSEEAWLEMIQTIKERQIKVKWILCPDSPADFHGTLTKFFEYRMYISRLEHPVCFAVQDGMTPKQFKSIPYTIDYLFIGGTDRFKWSTLPGWCEVFGPEKIHVGRVNSLDKLIICDRLNVSSVDGTYWFRFKKDWHEILRYFFEGYSKHKLQTEMEFINATITEGKNSDD